MGSAIAKVESEVIGAVVDDDHVELGIAVEVAHGEPSWTRRSGGRTRVESEYAILQAKKDDKAVSAEAGDDEIELLVVVEVTGGHCIGLGVRTCGVGDLVGEGVVVASKKDADVVCA